MAGKGRIAEKSGTACRDGLADPGICRKNGLLAEADGSRQGAKHTVSGCVVAPAVPKLKSGL